MRTSQVVAIVCMTGGLIAISGSPSGAQHSSGGTSPNVTEGKSESQGIKGRPGIGSDSGTASDEANSPESSKGTGYGLESGSHSERDIESSGHMESREHPARPPRVLVALPEAAWDQAALGREEAAAESKREGRLYGAQRQERYDVASSEQRMRPTNRIPIDVAREKQL